jgi:hypothetical protein
VNKTALSIGIRKKKADGYCNNKTLPEQVKRLTPRSQMSLQKVGK